MWEDEDEEDIYYVQDAYEVDDERKEEMLSTKFLNNKMSKRPAEFSLTMDNIEWPLRCPVLGILLNYGLKKGSKRSEASPSFDKLDPSRGYTPENTRIISWRANRIKNDGTAEEHLKIYEYMIKNQKP